MTASVAFNQRRDGSTLKMIGGAVLAEKPAWRRRSRKDWAFSVEMLRLREIEALIRHRHGGHVPDPEDTDDRETCLAYVRAAALALTSQDLDGWCRVFASWVTCADLLPIEKDAAGRRRMMRADGVAGLLHVTMAERTALGFRTIGACDMSKAGRKKLAKATKRERDRKRDEAKRRAAGARDRASYVAQSLSTLKPWAAAGMSRRTWYRKGCPTGGTSPSRVDIYRIGEEPVPAGDRNLPGHVHDKYAGRVAHGERGSGTASPAGLQGAAPHGSGEAPTTEIQHRRNAA